MTTHWQFCSARRYLQGHAEVSGDVLSHLVYVRKVWEITQRLIAKSHPNLSKSMLTNMTFVTRTWSNRMLNYAVMLPKDRLKCWWMLTRCRGVTLRKIVCWLFWGKSEVTLTLETSPGGWRASPRSLRGYSGPVPGSPAMEGGRVMTHSWVERHKVLGQRKGEFRCVRKSNKEFWWGAHQC